jgi:hypothetical protein
MFPESSRKFDLFHMISGSSTFLNWRRKKKTSKNTASTTQIHRYELQDSSCAKPWKGIQYCMGKWDMVG